jgi:hypothetical protein
LEKPPSTTPRVFDDENGRRIVFQVWDWADQTYTVNMFILREGKKGWRTAHYATTYRALLRSELGALLSACDSPRCAGICRRTRDISSRW